MLEKGTIISNRYEIIREIGRGGMSVVYLAMDVSLNKQWAVKAIDKTTPVYKAMVNTNTVLDEAEMMKRLDHNSLPRIVDIIDSKDVLYVIMDYVEGETLKKVLDLYGPFKQDDVIRWSMDLCDVLSYLHHQDPPIIYRDMKPANIMLKPEGTIKVIDFGIAREYKEGQAEDTTALGTRGYAAPEQFRGYGQTDERTDVYNLGVTMYQLLTGKDPEKPPFTILPITEVNSELSTGLEKIIFKATQNDPEKRYQTTEDMAKAIANYKKLENESIVKHKKNVRTYFLLLILAVVCGIGGAMCLLTGWVQTNNEYSALVNNNALTSSETQRNLKKAIDLKPEKPIAYEKLIQEYAKDGFNEDEASEFSKIYTAHQNEVAKDKEAYGELNFLIGKDILMYYQGRTDTSNRNKLLTAKPFFDDALTTGITGNNKVAAQSYQFLANYYLNYVVTNGSFDGKEASTEDYQNLILKCNSTLDTLQKYKGDDQKNLLLVTCSIVQSIISEQRDNMIEKKIGADGLRELNEKIKEVADSVDPGTQSNLVELKGDVESQYRIIVKELIVN